MENRSVDKGTLIVSYDEGLDKMGRGGGSGDRADGATDVSLIAHRGFAGVNPENTKTAFERAIDPDGGGADVVEFDVMPTADGDVAVFHDETLERVTDATESVAARPIWETPTATLRELDVLGTGESVPMLSDVLDVLPLDVDINVEFKNPGDGVSVFGSLESDRLDARRRAWRPFVEQVLDTFAAYGNDVLASSFHEAAVAAVRDVDPSVPIATVFRDSIEDGMRVARRHDCEYVHLPWNMIAGTDFFNAEYGSLGPYAQVDVVELAHGEGRRVNVWTVDHPEIAAAVAGAGVDGLIADHPDLLTGSATVEPMAQSR